MKAALFGNESSCKKAYTFLNFKYVDIDWFKENQRINLQKIVKNINNYDYVFIMKLEIEDFFTIINKLINPKTILVIDKYFLQSKDIINVLIKKIQLGLKIYPYFIRLYDNRFCMEFENAIEMISKDQQLLFCIGEKIGVIHWVYSFLPGIYALNEKILKIIARNNKLIINTNNYRFIIKFCISSHPLDNMIILNNHILPNPNYYISLTDGIVKFEYNRNKITEIIKNSFILQKSFAIDECLIGKGEKIDEK